MPELLKPWSNLRALTSQVLICDLQPEIVARSKTTGPEALSLSAEVLCRVAQLFEVPITLSVVPEGNKEPRLIAGLVPFASEANQPIRATASPFVDPVTRERLASLDRPTLILAGFATEVVVLHAAMHALEQGYGVIVAVDACGGMSDRTELAAFSQIQSGGGVMASVVSIATSLAPDFSTPRGQQMFEIVQTLRLA